MTKILVAFATKMGATKGIAEEIAGELNRTFDDVQISDAAAALDVAEYDAAIVGSALYASRWRPEAIALLTRLSERRRDIPIWLYQSGPCGPKGVTGPVNAPRRVERLAVILGAGAPTTFGGRIESATAAGFLARRMAKGPMAGDYRDFDEIRRWASRIAAALTVPAFAVGTPRRVDGGDQRQVAQVDESRPSLDPLIKARRAGPP